jgi:hypothetical protein
MCKTFIKDDEVVWIDVKNITLVLTVLDEIKQKRNELDKLRCLLKLALDKKTGLEFNFAGF